MTSKRLHLVLLVTLAFLFIALIIGAYNVNKLLAKQGDKLTTAKAQSLALQQEEKIYQKAKRDVITYSDLEKITRAVVPEDKNQAEAVREIVKIADENDVSLASITFPSSTLGSTTPSSTSASAAKPAAAAATSSATSKKAATYSQLLAVPSIPGVYQLPITVQSDTNNPVAYNKFVNFLSDLERNRRTAQVSTISLSPTANPNLVTFVLTINGYIKP